MLDVSSPSGIQYSWLVRPPSQGWLFLAVVLDLFSRRVVGWSMQSRMSAELVTDALVMALWRRRHSTLGYVSPMEYEKQAGFA